MLDIEDKTYKPTVPTALYCVSHMQYQRPHYRLHQAKGTLRWHHQTQKFDDHAIFMLNYLNTLYGHRQ